MNCIVLDHRGIARTKATVRDTFYADDGSSWASLVNKRGQLFYTTLERLRGLDGKRIFDVSSQPISKRYSSPDDEIFISTVMEFIASGAQTIAEFNALDPAHRRKKPQQVRA